MKTIRSKNEAFRHAGKLWGQWACVESNPRDPNPEQRYKVGELMAGLFFFIRGSGPDWTTAFANAARNKTPRVTSGGTDGK